jgi:hypothetical protein
MRGGGSHDTAALPASYAYLPGLYLGDRCISAHPRGVYRLRISLDLRYPEIVSGCVAAIRESDDIRIRGPKSRILGGQSLSQRERPWVRVV